MLIVTFEAHASYYPDSDSAQIRTSVHTYDDSTPDLVVTHHGKRLEVLSGGGTPSIIVTTYIRDAVIAWHKAIHRYDPTD